MAFELSLKVTSYLPATGMVGAVTELDEDGGCWPVSLLVPPHEAMKPTMHMPSSRYEYTEAVPV